MFEDILRQVYIDEQTEKKKNYVVFILDESGSMSKKENFVISTIKEQIEEIKKQDKFDTKIYFRKFNSHIGNLIEFNLNEDFDTFIKDKLNYNPYCLTSLYDAVGFSIKELDNITDPVLFIIITDCYENSSKVFTSSMLKELTEYKEKNCDWTFVYVGSDHDIHEQGKVITSSSLNTLEFKSTEIGFGNMSEILCEGIRGYYSAGAIKTNSFFENMNKKIF